MSHAEVTEKEATPAAFRLVPPQNMFFRWIEWLGFALLLLIAFLIPVFFIPIKIFPNFTIEDVVISGKNIALVILAAGVLILASIELLGIAWKRYSGLVFAAFAALLLFLVWGALAVLVSPVTTYSLQKWLPQLMAGAAALTGPLFLADTRRVRALLIAALAGGVVVALIGLTSIAGVHAIYTNIYGMDPRDMMADPVMRERNIFPGGIRSVLAMSTIGNPEYAGTYAGILAAISAVVLLDWATKNKRAINGWRITGLVLIGIFFLFIFLTERRQPWVAISLAGLVRLLYYLDVSRRIAAVGFIAVLFAGLLLDLKVAALLAILLLALMLIFALLRRNLVGRVKSSNKFNLSLMAGGPILILILLVAFSTPGPWNPGGLRLLQRFGSLLTYADQSYRERATMYMIASEMVWNDPVFGVGQGRYANRFTPSLADLVEEDESGVAALARERLGVGIGDQPHNDYLQLAAEQGVPSLLFFLTAMIILLTGLSRIVRETDGWPRLCALALVIGLVAFFSTMLTSFPLHMPSRSALFWALVAAALGLMTEHEARLRAMKTEPAKEAAA